MLSERINNELNEQVNRELFSAYLYLSMSAHFGHQNLEGMANWMYVQSKEEMTHAMKIYNYILERGGCVELKALAQPKNDWSKIVQVFEAALEHEKYITASIYNILGLARDEKDYATELMLNWFVTEQAEEEDNVNKVVEMLKMINDHPNGLFMADRELGQRTFANETGLVL